MKFLIKILLSCYCLLLCTLQAFACDNAQETPFFAKGTTTLKLNMRNGPCINGTKILGKTEVGQDYIIIAEALDYYKVQNSNGSKIFLWKNGIRIDQKLSKEDTIAYKVVNTINKKDKKTQKIIINKIKGITHKYNTQEKLHNILSSILILYEKQNQPSNKDITKPKKTKTTSPITENNKKDVIGDTQLSETVVHTWLSWYNNYRNKLGLANYKYDKRLEKTAIEWAKISRDRGYYSHKRNPGDSYYDYNKIVKWFKKRGVDCGVSGRLTVVENIGYGTYSCSSKNCDTNIINALKSTWNFYLNEKNKSYQPHYKSIISPYLQYMGFGYATKKVGKNRYKIYSVTHFCTKFK